MSYSNIQTFEELCELGAQYVNDELKKHTFWGGGKLTKGKNLYELDDNNPDHRFIQNCIYQCNLNGFCTWISQPELYRLEPLYISHWHSMKYGGLNKRNNNKQFTLQDG